MSQSPPPEALPCGPVLFLFDSSSAFPKACCFPSVPEGQVWAARMLSALVSSAFRELLLFTRPCSRCASGLILVSRAGCWLVSAQSGRRLLAFMVTSRPSSVSGQPRVCSVLCRRAGGQPACPRAAPLSRRVEPARPAVVPAHCGSRSQVPLLLNLLTEEHAEHQPRACSSHACASWAGSREPLRCLSGAASPGSTPWIGLPQVVWGVSELDRATVWLSS